MYFQVETENGKRATKLELETFAVRYFCDKFVFSKL